MNDLAMPTLSKRQPASGAGVEKRKSPGSAYYLRNIWILPVALLAASTLESFAQAPATDSPAVEQRVEGLLKKLSLEEKIDLLGGEENMYIRANAHIGLPRLKMTDGPEGTRTWGPSTAYAGGIALAATWDPALAQRMGVAMGRDARARGVNILLGPAVNIYRAPMNGRNFEYFGEDPLLAGRTAVGYIEGVQSQGVVATVKHYAMNDEEWDRNNVSSDADERTMREIYLPAFEMAVRDAKVGAVMNSYNLVNGIHATQNHYLNLDVLKGDWKFDGILMSDWEATYDGVEAAQNGLDLEMPRAKFMNRETLLPAVRDGKVPVATLDDKVRRILRVAVEYGFLDRPQLDRTIPLDDSTARQVALDEARESIVLLKNEGALLPLDPVHTRTIALVGPDAWPAVPGGGGSSNVSPYDAVSFLSGLTHAPGNVKVLYARGIPSPEELFGDMHFVDGVKVETFANATFSGAASVSQVDRIATWKANVWTFGVPPRQSIRYTATFLPSHSSEYLFLIAGTDSDQYKLSVDGKVIVSTAGEGAQAPRWTRVALEGGKPAHVAIDYIPNGAEPRIGLGIRAVNELVTAEAKEMIAAADAAIVSVGFDPATEGEGFDRTFALPWGQEELIHASTLLNKKTIVTLTAGGGVDTRAWLKDVPALLHNWYPGQEGGTALAEIVFGQRSPEGKLPMSFERSWEDNPVHDNYYAANTTPGQTPHVKYAEGVFVGYRYYTSTEKKPLFPFGFGLSYTQFAFSNLTVTAPQNSARSGSATASFDVTNTGKRPAAEVAQLYVGDPSAQIKRPARELKGFQKVRLDPGQTQRVSIVLDRRAFSYWDERRHQWQADSGKFIIYAGDSSDNTPLQADFAYHD